MKWPRRKLQEFAADVPYAFVGGPFGLLPVWLAAFGKLPVLDSNLRPAG